MAPPGLRETMSRTGRHAYQMGRFRLTFLLVLAWAIVTGVTALSINRTAAGSGVRELEGAADVNMSWQSSPHKAADAEGDSPKPAGDYQLVESDNARRQVGVFGTREDVDSPVSDRIHEARTKALRAMLAALAGVFLIMFGVIMVAEIAIYRAIGRVLLPRRAGAGGYERAPLTLVRGERGGANAKRPPKASGPLLRL